MSAPTESLPSTLKVLPTLSETLGSTVIFFVTMTPLSTSLMNTETYWSVRGSPKEDILGNNSAALIVVMLNSSEDQSSISLILTPSTKFLSGMDMQRLLTLSPPLFTGIWHVLLL